MNEIIDVVLYAENKQPTVIMPSMAQNVIIDLIEITQKNDAYFVEIVIMKLMLLKNDIEQDKIVLII